jgi:WhiB family redox-sensing transcriptional regulator
MSVAPVEGGVTGGKVGKSPVPSARARARVGTVATMAATATPEPPTTTLLELALACGFTVADQRWRARAACAGVDPELFLTDRGASPEPALVYCRRCEVRTECLQAALDLGQRAFGVWGATSALERRRARQRGLTATELIAEERTAH